MAETMLGVLEASGTVHAMVVYGHDGLDELSTLARSSILETTLDSSGVSAFFWEWSRDLGIEQASREDLLGGDAQHNAARVHAVLSGERGPQRDVVLLNAGAGLLVAGKADSLESAMALAEESIDSGAGLEALRQLIRSSNEALAAGLG